MTTRTPRAVSHDCEGPARPSRTSAHSSSNAEEDLHQLVEQHRGLAVHIAHQFFRHRPEHGDEYIAAALLGLVEAAASFDADAGPWPAWARLHILRHVLNAVRRTEHSALNPQAFEDRRVVRSAIEALQGSEDTDPTDADIATLTGLPEYRIAAAQRPSTTVQLHDVRDAAIDGTHDPDEDEWLERIELMRSWAYLERWCLWSLPWQQLHVIARRFGLDGERRATLQSLASDLGMSREAVRHLQHRALDTLRYQVSQAPS